MSNIVHVLTQPDPGFGRGYSLENHVMTFCVFDATEVTKGPNLKLLCAVTAQTTY